MNTYAENIFKELVFVSIPGGTFEMGDVDSDGDSDENPVHTVTLLSYEMSKYLITNVQYATYLTEALTKGDITVTNSSIIGQSEDYSGEEYLDLDSQYCEIIFRNDSFIAETGKENLPVTGVTWYGAKAFALYYGFDLPTEAEWEYACRGGKQYKFGTDDGTLDSSKANYNFYNVGHTTDVGSYPANPSGLYDMSGNVWEWCNDWYGSYSSESATSPPGPQTGSGRVNRGGNWVSIASGCRAAHRYVNCPGYSHFDLGFRVVRHTSS